MTTSERIPYRDPLRLPKCPHCKVDTPNLVRVYEVTIGHRKWGVFKCQRCQSLVTVYAAHGANEIVLDFFPKIETIDSVIPSPAFEYLSQANETLYAPAGSIMLSASAVDAMLKAKGYTDGNLFSRINKAAQDHIITEGMAQWAHQVRLDANDQRHADENAELPTQEDAVHTLEFAKALGQFLFVLPARVKRGLDESGGSGHNKPVRVLGGTGSGHGSA